jgi:hypothetical protein
MNYAIGIARVTALISLFNFQIPVFAQIQNYDAKTMEQVIRGASFEFCNEYFYKDEPAWKSRVISFAGYMVDKPAIGKIKMQYIQLMGNGVNGLISVIATYDMPLPTRKVYDNDIPIVTTGQHLRFVAEIKKAENFISVNGVWIYLPIVQLLAIYQQSDTELKNPLWVSKEFIRN